MFRPPEACIVVRWATGGARGRSTDHSLCLQMLKRKEKEFEHEMERLAREKIATQQRLAELRDELSQWVDGTEMERLLRQAAQPEDDQASTSTASGRQARRLGQREHGQRASEKGIKADVIKGGEVIDK